MSESPSTPTLPTFSWIGHLKEDDRELLSSYGEFFPAYPETVVIEEGTLQTEVLVVITGELQVHGRDDAGSAVLLAKVGPGETLGEISLFDPAPATATVLASEFSQLWRIADEDLIQFMEDNPGAGNVLLRTLATILAQRLRQVDPEAFGLSAYAVVDSPELEEQDAILEEQRIDQESEFLDSAEAAAAANPPASAPDPMVDRPVSPVSPVRPIRPEMASAEPVTEQTLAPTAAEMDPAPAPGRDGLRAPPDAKPALSRKIRTGTQYLPHPDDLEDPL